MNLNLTLIGQAIAFAIFVYLCMTFIWPPLLAALNARKAKIAGGLEDAAKARKELERAQKSGEAQIAQGKKQADEIINQASKEASVILQDAKDKAVSEGKKMIDHAQKDIVAHTEQAKKELQEKLSSLVVQGVEQVIAKTVNKDDHQQLLTDLAVKL